MLQVHLSHDEVFAIRCSDVPAVLEVPSLSLLCRMRRLTFFGALLRVGNDSIWALLLYEGSWIRQICDDFRWLWTNARTTLPFPCSQSWHEWKDFILQRHGSFRALVKKAGTIARQKEWLESLSLRSLRLLGVWKLQQCPARKRPISKPYWCGPCHRSLASKAALATHFFQMHGRVARFRHLAYGSLCNACGRQFRGPQQFALHLRASKACCDKLSTCGYWQDSVVPGIGSTAWIAACRRDLGLTLPTEPQFDVPANSEPPLIWDESPVLVAAHLGRSELWLDSSADETSTMLQYCLFLAEFPLFPEEIQLVAETTAAAIEALDVRPCVSISDEVQKFFSGESDGGFSQDLGNAALEDDFWRLPAPSRPPFSGVWKIVATADQGCRLDIASGERIHLLEHWHEGDWPPGLPSSHCPLERLCPKTQRCLLHLLVVLTCTWGWLEAPQDSWDSAISVPFARFHFARN